MHTKLFFKSIHAKHHSIIHPHGPYDGIYGTVLDGVLGMITIVLPVTLVPSIHIFTVVTYLVLLGVLGQSMNHCGREFIIAFKGIVLYNNQHHDDHHVYHTGNYSDLLPLLDQCFGTERNDKNRQQQKRHSATITKKQPAHSTWANQCLRMHLREGPKQLSSTAA
jgi:sterol desaturase/sphingolipid hydroxylase (fatty acid hydroxylase superfamily)